MDQSATITHSQDNGWIVGSLIWGAELFDLLTFILSVSALGIGVESNPIVTELYNVGGFPLIIIAKLLVAQITYELVMTLHDRGATTWAGASLIPAIFLPIFGGITNTITLSLGSL